MGRKQGRFRGWRSLKRKRAKQFKKNLENFKNKSKKKTNSCDEFQEGFTNYNYEATNAIEHHYSNLNYPGPEITTSNSLVTIIEKEDGPETTINVLPLTHRKEEISVKENEEEDQPGTKINYLPIEQPQDLHTKQSFLTKNEKKEQPKITIIVLPTLNLRDQHKGERTEINRTKQETPLNRMRFLIEDRAKGDKFALFGEQIANKFRRSKKHVSEINIAKQYIDKVLQNLLNSNF